jgi:hypothetical protein
MYSIEGPRRTFESGDLKHSFVVTIDSALTQCHSLASSPASIMMPVCSNQPARLAAAGGQVAC